MSISTHKIVVSLALFARTTQINSMIFESNFRVVARPRRAYVRERSWAFFMPVNLNSQHIRRHYHASNKSQEKDFRKADRDKVRATENNPRQGVGAVSVLREQSGEWFRADDLRIACKQSKMPLRSIRSGYDEFPAVDQTLEPTFGDVRRRPENTVDTIEARASSPRGASATQARPILTIMYHWPHGTNGIDDKRNENG